MPAKTATKTAKYTIDCTTPVGDNVLDVTAFEKFLHDRIKVGGKTGVLGNKVKISLNNAKVTVQAQQPFSKRYLKYLTKKYLKKSQVRDWLRVIAVGKNSYQVRYFRFDQEEEETQE